MNEEKKAKGMSAGGFIILMASVTGLCLVAKVLMIRHVFDQSVDVTELIIPTVIPIFADYADRLYRKKEVPPRFRFNHPWLWNAIIVIATGLSLIRYLR